MKIAIIIPAHNEQQYILKTLESLLAQTYLPAKIIVVDDHSTDDTLRIASSLQSSLVQVIERKSSAANIPGSKVINAFNEGLECINLSDFDLICKYDADLIFPKHYLQEVVLRFRESENTGMVAGHCTIESQGKWVIENINNPDHIRGALKTYSVGCFNEIGGLQASIGWDTLDEMLARFYDWDVVTIPNLHVKHLKPTGAAYNSRSKKLQGQAFYKLGYGVILTTITALKMSFSKGNITLIHDYLSGYYDAKKANLDRLVTTEQASFIRSYRWRGIKSRLGLK